MAKIKIDSRTNDSQHIIYGDNTFTVTKAGSIGVDNFNGEPYAIYDDAGWNGNVINIQGKVHGVYNYQGVYGAAIYSTSNGIAINIAITGEVSGTYGIEALGDNPTITNKGEIIGLDREAILLGDETGGTGGTVDNFGRIMASSGVIVDTENAKVINEKGANITAWNACIALAGSTDATTVINHGMLYSYYNGEAFFGGDGNDKIVNDGTIIGDLLLARGDDTVDNRGGKIDGNIQGDAGDDTLITDKATDVLQEVAGEGNDTVKSTVSYKLSDNVETLVLLGKGNTNATGNDDVNTNNYLYGNDGDNTLKGLGGYNELFGKGGTDTLIGGSDVDVFGIGKHYGHDTVKGFTEGTDLIDIYKLGPDNFDDLKSHIEKHGNDTWIDFGKDVLILQGINHNTLTDGDFTFNY